MCENRYIYIYALYIHIYTITYIHILIYMVVFKICYLVQDKDTVLTITEIIVSFGLINTSWQASTHTFLLLFFFQVMFPSISISLHNVFMMINTLDILISWTRETHVNRVYRHTHKYVLPLEGLENKMTGRYAWGRRLGLFTFGI